MKERVKWLDCARGIGMLLVVLGHTAPSAFRYSVPWVLEMYDYIFLFHMPFLFFLSGYAFRLNQEKYERVSNGSFFKAKAKGLLVPYVVYATFVYIIFYLLNCVPGLGSLLTSAGYGKQGLIGFLVGLIIGNNYFSIHLWYIYDLFLYEIIAFVFLKLKINKKIMLVCSIVCLYLWCVLNTSMSLAWEDGLLYFIWFTLGAMLPVEKIDVKIGVPSFIAWSILYILDKFTGFSDYTILNYLLSRNVICLFAIFALVALAKIIKGKIENILSYIGKNSMCLYLFHQPFCGSCFVIFAFAIMGINPIICVIGSFVLSFIVFFITYTIISKNKILGFLFGIKYVTKDTGKDVA